MEQPVVILFTQDGCGESRQTRSWLAEHDIPFLEHNVSSDPNAAQDLAATGIFATPLLAVAGRTVLGFRAKAIEAALRAGNIM